MPGCKWKPEWQRKYSWALPVKGNPQRVFCSVCNSDFCCNHGSAELKRHEENNKHKNNLERRKVVDAAGTRSLSITDSFKKAEAISSEQKKIKDAALIAEASISNLQHTMSPEA